ncbi:class I SAM-dependent methyltransferase [Haladaptatus sp.]|uniref:class I SAM-dependent methyltransferase n=1 Tax=Haladaptatus sp. TaxID=1973141 RepID=UPI003C511F7B
MFDSMEPRRFYDEEADWEWGRRRGSFLSEIAFEGTFEYLHEFFPDDGLVLDAGGGPGRYSIRLAERGNSPVLLDVSRTQLRTGREKITEHDVADRVRTVQGDLRGLPFDDDTFDGVCCLGGALSHILDADGRAAALDELRRVATPGSPIVVSVFGRLANLEIILREGNLETTYPLLLPEARSGDYTRELAMQTYDEPDWTECHYYRLAELEAEFEQADLWVERTAGFNGICTMLGVDFETHEKEVRETVRELLRELREDRTVVDISREMFAVARVPSNSR